MKVIIDLIEDIRSVIEDKRDFSLGVMGLKEDEKAEFSPVWQSKLCSYKLDETRKKLFIFLGQGEAINVGAWFDVLDGLSNEEMMYEVQVSYSKEEKRQDSQLIGFGEDLSSKRYLLFIAE